MTQPSTLALPDHYATLQVSETASPEVITAAYRSLARKYHPDANPSPGADAKMKAINAAYDVLSDRNKRAVYDRQRVAAAKPAVAPAPPPPPKAPPVPPKAQPAPPPQTAPNPPAAAKSFSIGSVLSSPAFSTFVIAFIIVFAALTILAEALMQYDYEWLIIPMAIGVAAAVAFVRSRRKA
jgi:curved DNA-binding protein CbpA